MDHGRFFLFQGVGCAFAYVKNLFGCVLHSSKWGCRVALGELVPFAWVVLAVVSDLRHISRFVRDVSGGFLILALLESFSCALKQVFRVLHAGFSCACKNLSAALRLCRRFRPR